MLRSLATVAVIAAALTLTAPLAAAAQPFPVEARGSVVAVPLTVIGATELVPALKRLGLAEDVDGDGLVERLVIRAAVYNKRGFEHSAFLTISTPLGYGMLSVYENGAAIDYTGSDAKVLACEAPGGELRRYNAGCGVLVEGAMRPGAWNLVEVEVTSQQSDYSEPGKPYWEELRFTVSVNGSPILRANLLYYGTAENWVARVSARGAVVGVPPQGLLVAEGHRVVAPFVVETVFPDLPDVEERFEVRAEGVAARGAELLGAESLDGFYLVRAKVYAEPVTKSEPDAGFDEWITSTTVKVYNEVRVVFAVYDRLSGRLAAALELALPETSGAGDAGGSGEGMLLAGLGLAALVLILAVMRGGRR